ncbi:MAG: tetratricopeptide repeat protein [Actinomycetaceae bacterium]|nr:tetratricopeptide repeat protein [Actinomycetaceae bacterium]MDU0969788.1 tetratricopeptide repeat protein [Actinomycetaceae bacterium]
MGELRPDALETLGLDGSGLTPEDVRSRRDELLAYLDQAPPALRDTAGTKAHAIEDAADTLLAQLADALEDAQAAPEGQAASEGATVSVQAKDPSAALAELGEDEDAIYSAPVVTTPSVTKRKHADEQEILTAEAKKRAAKDGPSGGSIALAVIIGIVACAVVVLAVYVLGRPQMPANHPDVAASQTMPSEAETTMSASERAEKVATLKRAIDKDPQDEKSRLELGVVLFEGDDLAGAKEQWDKVLEIDPNNAEVYFNLGFWYLSQDPPNKAEANKAWDRVLALEPQSEMAQIIQMHRGQASISPGPSDSTAGAPTPSDRSS